MTSTISPYAVAFTGLLVVVLTIVGIAMAQRLLPANFLTAAQNERSNHTGAPRQLGGLVLAPVVLMSLAVLVVFDIIPASGFHWVLAGLITLYLLGFFDDWKSLGIGTRLVSQFLAAFLLFVGATATSGNLLAGMGVLISAILLLATIYWINLVNFMDGLDLLSVTGLTIPLLTLGFILFAVSSDTQTAGLIAILAVAGLLGFAFFNTPPARVFLGDSGSLFLGGASAYSALLTGLNTSPVIALLPFLYYLCDGSLTLLLRLSKRQNIFKAHSSHAYQFAFRHGRSALSITGHIFLLNVVLASLTFLTLSATLAVQLFTLSAGIAMSCYVIWKFRNSAMGAERQK